MQQGSRKCQPWELEPRAKRESWELGLPCTQVSTWPPKRMISTWVLRSATSCLCYRRQTQNSLRSSLRNTLMILDSMKIVSVSMCFQSLRLCLTESMQPKCGTKLPLLPGTGAQVQEFAIGPEALATGVVEANLKQGSRWVKMGQDGSRWAKQCSSEVLQTLCQVWPDWMIALAWWANNKPMSSTVYWLVFERRPGWD